MYVAVIYVTCSCFDLVACTRSTFGNGCILSSFFSFRGILTSNKFSKLRGKNYKIEAPESGSADWRNFFVRLLTVRISKNSCNQCPRNLPCILNKRVLNSIDRACFFSFKFINVLFAYALI